MESACRMEGRFSPCLFWTTQQCLRPFSVHSLADAFSWTSFSALDGKHVGATATQHFGCFKAQFWDRCSPQLWHSSFDSYKKEYRLSCRKCLILERRDLHTIKFQLCPLPAVQINPLPSPTYGYNTVPVSVLSWGLNEMLYVGRGNNTNN